MMHKKEIKLPDAQPTLRVIPMGHDTNPRGDIFGGWLMSKIDIAGSIVAYEKAKGPIATVSVKELTFLAPLFVGDIVSFYAKALKIGQKSVTIQIDVFAQRTTKSTKPMIVHVSEARLVYVAISEPGKSRMIPA